MSQRKKNNRVPLLLQPKFKVELLLLDLEFFEKMGKELRVLIDRGVFTNETTIAQAREVLAYYRSEYRRLIKEAEKL